MTDKHQVIQLDAMPDAGFTDRGAVHASIGLHFDVVLKHGRPGLDHLVPSPVLPLGEAKAVTADNRAVLQNDAVAKAAMLAHNGVGVSDEVVTNLGSSIDGNEAVEDRMAANFRTFANVGRLRDDRRRVNARSVFWRLVKKFKGVRKSQIGIGGPQGGKGRLGGVALDGHVFLYEYRRSASGLQEREVFSVSQKSDLAGTGMFDAGDTGNLDVPRTFETTVQFLSKVGEFHGRSSSKPTQVKKFKVQGLGK